MTSRQRHDGKRRGPMGPHGPMMPAEKAKDFKGTAKKFFAYLGGYKVALIFVIVFALGGTAFNIVGPKVLSQATTELFNGLVEKVKGTGGIDFDFIAGILVATLALYVLSSLCSFVQSWIMSGISQRMCYKLRQDIAEKINRMPFGFFDKSSIGDTLSRITNDVDTLGQSLNQSLTQAITSCATIVGVVVMMFTINLPMTLVTLLLLPLSAVLMFIFVKASQKHFLAQQQLLGEVNGVVEETISGHDIVKAFNQQQRTIDAFNEANSHLYDASWRAMFLSSFMRPVMDFVGNLGYVAVALLGSVFAVQGIITVGDIQAFIQYVKNLTQPLSQLTQISNIIQQLVAAAERIFEFLEQDEESPDGEMPASASQARDAETGTIVFDHVRFGYVADKPVINDFSTIVRKGQTVALVGPTGAGKTTIVKLLMRFYDVNGGAIRLDGRDVREFSRADIRSRFGMVLQDTWLFNGTIRENIRYGRLDASDQEVEDAAKAAFAHHFIQTLPGGYDFVINEDASNISQGQRQLLTIARAVLANREILILDEATSSVDMRTEEHIQRAMDALMKGRTSFDIAHRLSTIRSADLILVVDNGDIIEQGTHEQLLVRKGFYADLYNSQFAKCDDTVDMD